MVVVGNCWKHRWRVEMITRMRSCCCYEFEGGGPDCTCYKSCPQRRSCVGIGVPPRTGVGGFGGAAGAGKWVGGGWCTVAGGVGVGGAAGGPPGGFGGEGAGVALAVGATLRCLKSAGRK